MASDTVSKSPTATGKNATVEHYRSTVLVQGLTLGIGILTGVLAARVLGPTGRGEYAAIFVWSTGIAGVISFGINQAIAFHLGQRTFTTSEIATAIAVIGTIQGALSISIGLSVLSHALASYSPSVQQLGAVFVLFTPALILGGYPANLFQGRQDLLRFNLIRALTPFSYCAGLVTLYVLHRRSLPAVIGTQALSFIISLSVGIAMVWRLMRPHWQWNKAVIPCLVRFGSRIQATNLTTYFNQRIDQVILSLFVPPQQLGLYAVAVSLSTAVSVFPQAAGIVAFSKGSSQHRDDAKETIGTAFRASLIWLLVACSILYVLAPLLIRHVFGTAFEGSILACRILIPGALMTGLSQVLYNGASALGRPGLPSIAEGVSMVVTAVGLYAFVPRWGFLGAAVVSSIAYSIAFILVLILANNLLGLGFRDLLFGGQRDLGFSAKT